jgi:uncharacterized damage-inducible protein DinB
VTVKDLEELFDYDRWANRRLCAVIAQLTPAQFTQPVAGSYGSVRNTMVHALSAEWGWVDRCGGPARGPRLNPDDYPTPGALVELWGTIERHVSGFLAGLKDDDLAREVEFAIGAAGTQSMRLGHLMQHAFVHGVHHRGQVALLLRLLGHAPGDVDMLFYFAASTGAHP